MYNSQYYTCEQIDQRLLQGYLDDYNSENNTNLTKTQFLNLLATHLNSGLITTDIVQESGNNMNKIMSQAIVTQLLSNLQSNINARDGYYQATISGGTITVNAPNYLLGSGGNLRIKMPSAGTTASTLTIGNANEVPLWYNGAGVSDQNTWEEDEIISVFYDGIRFMASNSQGGGGKAEKVKYDSQSGLGADNVQDALDEVTSLVPRDISCEWVRGSISTATGLDTQNTHRIRSKYIAVKEGDTINVNAKEHYVGIYLYNTDKTTAIGDYAMGLTAGEYSYICPQDGFVRFIESKAADNTQDITPSEQIAEINIDASSVVTPKELDAAINDLLSTEVDISALSMQVGYPSATGVWLTATINNGVYRYHKLITRTAEMKKIKVDAPQDHAARYCFITDYTVPVRNSTTTKEPTTPTPCNFCENPAVVHVVNAGSSSGWVDIPNNCAYIVLVVQNGSAQYIPSAVYVCKDNTDYDTTGMRMLDNSAFVQGNFDADGKTNASSTQRLRTNAYYKVNEGDKIILDYQEQKLQVWKYDNNKDYLGNTGWYTERIFECENDGYLRFTAATARSNDAITTLYGKVYIPAEKEWRNEYADKVPNVARPPRNGNVVKSKMLTLLTFSDIHLDRKDELQRILSFNDKYAAYLDDMISLGDLQDRGFESDIAVFRELADAGAKNVLQVIGNHDYYNSGANVWTYNTDANVYARFFAPFISNWGVVNSADTLYWYKDYTDTNTYTGTDAIPRKIRLIAINTNNNGSNVDKFDSAQQTWLTNVLADAKTNDFSVVVASHYKPRMTYIDCNFSDKTLQLSNEENYANNTAATIIQEFIDGGGKFICWLCGHEHNDYVGVTSVAGTSQLVIGVSLAQCGVRVNYSVMDRVEGTKSQDLFNIIGFDTYNKHVRILRIGADMDIFMRSKKTLCINYETHDIIAQS